MYNCKHCTEVCPYCDKGINEYYDWLKSQFVPPEGYTRSDGSPCQFEDYNEAKSIMFDYQLLKETDEWERLAKQKRLENVDPVKSELVFLEEEEFFNNHDDDN